jgi:hypothetical protein
MRTFLGAILGVIAIGVLLIAYGVFNPRVATADSYQVARPTYADRVTPVAYADNLTLRDDTPVGAPQLQIRCEPGQRAVIRQVGGAAAGECIDDGSAGYGPRATRASMVYPASEVRTLRQVQPVRTYQSAPRRAAARVDRSGRDWGKTAMVIGGTSAAGAGIGAIFAGKKGALIGAALGGGAGTIYEVKH